MLNLNFFCTVEKLAKSDSERNVLFTASVAELRRKAQEHSAALWQTFKHIGAEPESSEAAKNAEKTPEAINKND